MNRRVLAALAVPLVIVAGPAVTSATLPPDGTNTDFVRRQGEAAAVEYFAAVDAGVTQIACVAPAQDAIGELFLCYGTASTGDILIAQATINDDGGVDLTAAPAGPTAPTAPSTSAPSPVLGSFQGTGSSVVPVDPITGPTIVSVSHDGAGDFAVQPQQGGVAVGEPLLNVTGAWSGRYLVGLGGSLSAFGITADGNWTLEVQSMAGARSLLPEAPISGEASDVISYRGGESMPVTVEHEGSGGIVVSAVSGSGTAVLVDTTGPFSGEVTLPPGPGFVTVDASDAWSVAYSEAPATTAVTTPSTTPSTAPPTTLPATSPPASTASAISQPAAVSSSAPATTAAAAPTTTTAP